MNKKDIETIYPLSPMQQGMLFHSLYAPQSGVYVEQLTCLLPGDLHVPALERAFQYLVGRHSVLRTSFVWRKIEQTLQVVYRQAHLPLEVEDWTGLSEQEQDNRLACYLQADRERGFDLMRPPLLRLALFHLSPNAYRLVWTHHHMLLDGWSMPILLQELVACYNAFRIGREVFLPAAPAYRDYIAWLQRQDLSCAEEFWREYLKGLRAATQLEGSLISPAAEAGKDQPAEYEEQEISLSLQATAALQALVRRHQITLNVLIQGAWALLLSRYTRDEDILFGATVSGRPADLADSVNMVGLLINTLPVRIQVHPQQPALQWLKHIQARQAALNQFEYSPLVKVQEWSEIPRGQPLFDSLLVFENYPVTADPDSIEGLRFRDLRNLEHTNYPVTLIASARRNLQLRLSYDSKRVDPAAARRALGHLLTLIQGMLENPDQPVSRLGLLTPTERHQILSEWNETYQDFPSAACAHLFFEEQAVLHPHAPALIFGERYMSYAELDQKSNQLALYLRQQLGVEVETLVGICADRSIEMIVGILGVLKAGGAFLPLDPSYPRNRLAYMLEDSRVPVLLTQSHLQPDLPNTGARVFCLDRDWEQAAQYTDVGFPCPAAPHSLAYVIYTSGSTGQPKGVMLEHQGLCNLILSQVRDFQITHRSRVLQFASICFDASVSEIFTALSSGAALVLAPQEVIAFAPDLVRLINQQKVTVATLPPSLLALLDPREVSCLRTLISAGEACPPDVAARWFEDRHFFNGYGPTEATVEATLYPVHEIPAGALSIPIGRPMSNSQAYVLDADLQPVPVGVPGELHISGVNLGRGYLNRPELTAQKFIPNPFSSQPGARMYKTGDLVRWLPDGGLDYLGRIDHQVKIRGFRVELGEIEAALLQHAQVRQAVVVARDEPPAGKRLVAYLVALEAEQPPTPLELRTLLKQTLPDYMLPSAFIFLETLPMTLNGKVDRKALPTAELSNWNDPQQSYLAPRTPTEEILAGIWTRLLGVSPVGLNSNFFELGGHSLLATQLVSRIREAFGVELPLRCLFETPLLADLAQKIDRSMSAQPVNGFPPLLPVSRGGPIPLSLSQQRLWFLDQLEPENPFYNLPAAVRLRGQVDIPALQQSLDEIIRRHEILRTVFQTQEGNPSQVLVEAAGLLLQVADLCGEPVETREQAALRLAQEETRRPFHLDRGPLLRASLYRLGEGDYILLLVMHHIISDAWSMGVLVEELAGLYPAFQAGSPSPLPELPIQYADYAAWQRDWIQGELLDAQLSYWKEKLAGLPPLLEVPTDRPRPAVQSYRGSIQQICLTDSLTASLKSFCQKEGVTLYMLLLAVYQVLLSRYTGQEDIPVGTALANRTRSEVEGLIGFFINNLVIRGDLSGEPTFRETLKRVRETCLSAYTHQDLPFETLVETLQPHRDLSRSPLFQVAFNLQASPLGSYSLPGVELEPLDLHNGSTSFDLLLNFTDTPTGLVGSLEYNTDLFDGATIRRMLDHYLSLLASALADPEQPVTHLPLLTTGERQQMLSEWNATEQAFSAETCAHHLFEGHTRRSPTHPALRMGEQSLSYADLDARANRLARALQRLGAGPETLVGVCADRSFEMIVAVLGVLKAGAAFLPLDPAYPRDRLAFMLEDSRAPVLLTQSHLLDRLPPLQAQVLCLDTELARIESEPAQAPPCASGPASLAYVIYTSGSTGRPKGALLHHCGLCNLVEVQRRAFDVEPDRRILQFSSSSFDASVWEIFMALGNGATLVLAPQQVLSSPPDLLSLLQRARITHATLPPTVLQVLPAGDLPDLQVLVAAGEACPAELVERWAPGRRFFNAYGPTETTVCASMALCEPGSPRPPSIGRPIGNMRIYVLDPHMELLPPGVPGELYIAGVGVGRGYLNRPELTAQKFILNPFSSDPASRLYRTGDRVRSRPDGNIEFLGRLDDQVKLRGFRIELGEIEAILLQLPRIRQAALLVREDTPGDKRLVAYLVAANPAEPLARAELLDGLRARLPEYMLPSLFVFLDALPLTPSGKIDRHRLPDPRDVQSAEVEHPGAPPRTPTEAALVEICLELLGPVQIGVEDSFFDLGGHSLMATQLISRVREKFQVDLPLRVLFEQPTIAGLAECVDRARQNGPADQNEQQEKALQALKAVAEMTPEEVERLLSKT